MTMLTIELSDDIMRKVQEKAQQEQMDLTAWIYTLIESSVDNQDDDIELSKEEILNDIREGITDALNGDYGRPAREFLDELRTLNHHIPTI